MRKIRLLIMLAAMTMPLMSLYAGTALVVELNTGFAERFALLDEPELTISGTKLVVKTTVLEESYERSDVKSFYFENKSTGIGQVQGNTAISINQIGIDQFLITGISDEDRITVSNHLGQTFEHVVSREGGQAMINLSTSYRGVYIIKIGKNKTLKINKR